MKGQLKVSNKDKDKKIKPIKQPVKVHKNHMDNSNKPQDYHQLKLSDKQSKQKIISQSIKTNDITILNYQNICTQLLVHGNIQSFIDLFYISHHCLPNVMEKKNYFGEILKIPQLGQAKQENIQFLNDLGQSLCKAQCRPQSSRQEKEQSMSQYNSMAFNYQDQGDFITSAYFYQRVIELAYACKNKQYQLVALLGLGKCYDQQHQKDKAIQILEDAFDNASIIQNQEQRNQLTKLIGKQLIQIYIKKAQQCQKVDIDSALHAYQSSLKIAKRANEAQNQARISHKIGQLYYDQGKYIKSVEYQQIYISLLKASSNQLHQDEIKDKQNALSLKTKEMQAHASLAKCYLKLKDIEKAQYHLFQYNKMAKQAKAQNSVADSSYYLAKLFQQKLEKQKAISYYQSYFQAAKSQKLQKKDRKLVDKARVVYAIAKANKNMQKYIGIFNQQNSLKAVLDWKIKRILK